MDLQDTVQVSDALVRLAVARGTSLDEVALEVYLTDLARYDAGLVVRACERWRTVPRREFEAALPELGRLIQTVERLAHEDAEAAQAARLLPMPASDEPTYVCRECLDGYWRLFWCPGVGAQRGTKHARHDRLETAGCGRVTPHRNHPCAERCTCVDTNPVIQRQLHQQRRHVTPKEAA